MSVNNTWYAVRQMTLISCVQRCQAVPVCIVWGANSFTQRAGGGGIGRLDWQRSSHAFSWAKPLPDSTPCSGQQPHRQQLGQCKEQPSI